MAAVREDSKSEAEYARSRNASYEAASAINQAENGHRRVERDTPRLAGGGTNLTAYDHGASAPLRQGSLLGVCSKQLETGKPFHIAIPLPRARFWGLHQRLAELDAELRTPFTFSLKADELHNGNWMAKSAEFETPAGAASPPPREQINVSISPIIDYIDKAASTITGSVRALHRQL